MRRTLLMAGSVAALLSLAGCSAPFSQETGGLPSRPTGTTSAKFPGQETTVRFSAGETAVDVIIRPDNPTAQDFLTLLPLTISVEEFAGKEKLGRLPRALETAGSTGSDPADGDLIYFIPWGNLGFYYDTDGVGYSDQTIHLGTYTATREQLAKLEGGNVRVEVVQ